MYAEVCAYLTSNKYFELPTYRVKLFSSFFYIINVYFIETSSQFYSYFLCGYFYWHVSCRCWSNNTF